MLLSRYRSWIFFSFVVLFGMTAATVLFFAFGYRYSFERGIFIFSGSITVKTIPETVSLVLDGKPLPRQRLGLLNNSIHIAGLMPGEHTLALSAPDHASWEKRIIVESGISREFWNIILPRTHYPFRTLNATATTVKIFPHPSESDQLVLVKEQAGETSLVFFNYRTETSTQVFALPASHFDATAPKNLEWSWFDNGRYVILPLTRGSSFEHLIIDTRDGSFFSLEKRFNFDTIANVRWKTEEPNKLLFLSGSLLYELSLANNELPQLLSDNVLTYSFANDTLYTLGKEGQIWEERGDRWVTITPPLPFDASVPLTLTAYARDRLALLEAAGTRRLVAVFPNPSDRTPSIKQVASGVRTIQFSNDGKKLLFATDYEIGVIFMSEWEVQPRREAGDNVQVARFSEPIAHVQWAENYEHILFSRGNIIKFIELDGRDRRIIADIQSLAKAPTQILPHFSTNELLIVIPETDILSLTFPEPQTLFGQ